MTQTAYTVGWDGDWVPSKFHPLAQGRIVFNLKIMDTKITQLDYQLGSNHRGDEKVLEVRDFRQGLSLINRPNWQNPIAAEIAYAEAAEELMGLKPPARAIALREVVLTLQNLISANRFAAAILDSFSIPPNAHLDYAESLTKWHEQVTGARLHDAFVRLGGVGDDVDNSLLSTLQSWLDTNPCPSLANVKVCSAAIPGLQKTVQALDTTSVTAAISSAISTEAPHFVQLPKVVKVPRGQSRKTVKTWIGTIAVWLFSDGGKSPSRLHIQPASLDWLVDLKTTAIGLTLAEFQEVLITSPIGIGEIER